MGIAVGEKGRRGGGHSQVYSGIIGRSSCMLHRNDGYRTLKIFKKFLKDCK